MREVAYFVFFICVHKFVFCALYSVLSLVFGMKHISFFFIANQLPNQA